MLTKKSNPVPSVTEAHVKPADMLRHVIVSGKATKTAALQLCYSAASFILLVNHFRDAKAKDYMTRSDAVDYLRKQIKEQAGVLGNMLDLYIRNANALVGALVGSQKIFSATIQRLATAETPDAMVNILSDWMDKNHQSRIESMSELSVALGYKISRPTKAANTPASQQVQTKVETAVKAAEKIAKEAGVSETKVAQAVVNNVRSPLTLIAEAIKRITNDAELAAIEQAVKTQRSHLKDLAHRAAQSVKNGNAQQKLKAAVKGKRASATRASV